MFIQKRLLKKDRNKKRKKQLIFSGVIILFLFVLGVFVYTNFSFGRKVYINPVLENQQTGTSNLEQTLKGANINFSNIKSNNDGSYSITLSDGGEVILSSKKDLKAQLSSLQLILSRLTIEGKKLKIVDFRYDRPVISF